MAEQGLRRQLNFIWRRVRSRALKLVFFSNSTTLLLSLSQDFKKVNCSLRPPSTPLLQLQTTIYTCKLINSTSGLYVSQNKNYTIFNKFEHCNKLNSSLKFKHTLVQCTTSPCTIFFRLFA